MIDLHVHTTASDGILSPEDVVDLAVKIKLKAIAITDHDVIDGVEEAINHAKGKDIEIIPGIEVRANEPEHGFKSLDVIGLFVDHKNKDLIEFSERIKNERIRQKKETIKKLQDLGFEITFEEIAKDVKGAFGRPHIARALLKKYPKEFSSVKDVFDKYLGSNKSAYIVRKEETSIKDAVDIIHKAGGIAFLAHPEIFGRENSEELIGLFKEAKGEGIETYYPYHIICPDLKIDGKQNNEIIEFYKNIAEKDGFIESGGSDFHGGERMTMGKLDIPDSVLEIIRKLTKI